MQRKLVQLENYLNNSQWQEYGQLIVELLDEPDEGLCVVEGSREEKLYVDFTNYCQRLLANAPVQAREAYRRLVDSRAEAMYQRGLAGLDESVLQYVADNMFCSSWGDDVLWTIGELAMSRGEHLAARTAWQQLDGDYDGLKYPDTSISPAEVAARLALTSIRASQWDRAEQQMENLKRRYPQAEGTWGGRQIVFAEELPTLLRQAQQWPALPAGNSWPTLGGSFQRSYSSPQAYDGYPELVWQFPLSAGETTHLRQPLISEELVIVHDSAGIHALDRDTGKQVFLADAKALRQPIASLISHRNQVIGATGNELWAIDADREGALAFRFPLDEPSEQIVGDGVVDGTQLLLEIRSQDQFPRSGIACFDLATRQLTWKRWITSSNIGGASPGTSLAASPGVVYLSTNLGAIAAVRVTDGRILWLRTYSRSLPGQPDAHASACLITDGTLLVLPIDSRQLLAIDPTDGRLLWTRSGIVPQGSLVGAAQDRIVLNSNGLHILDVQAGDVVASNFDFTPAGQGLLVGETVYVPTEQGIERINLNSGERLGEGIVLPLSGSISLLGCGDCLLAIDQTQLSMFSPPLDLQRATDGK